MSRGGGGAAAGGDRGLEQTGLIRDTRKVGWILREAGSFRCTAEGLMIQSISKGPMNRGESFLEATFNGRSFDEKPGVWSLELRHGDGWLGTVSWRRHKEEQLAFLQVR